MRADQLAIAFDSDGAAQSCAARRVIAGVHALVVALGSSPVVNDAVRAAAIAPLEPAAGVREPRRERGGQQAPQFVDSAPYLARHYGRLARTHVYWRAQLL